MIFDVKNIILEMTNYFSDHFHDYGSRRRAILLKENSAEMLDFIRLIFRNQDAVKGLITWAQSHQMELGEISPEDLEEVQNRIRVAEVHNS